MGPNIENKKRTSNQVFLSEKTPDGVFFIDDFSQLSTQRVRNKKLPAMRVGNKRLYQKITSVL